MAIEDIVTIESIKTSLRIDHSLDDQMIAGYIQTAAQYIVAAIDIDYSDGSLENERQFQFAVSLLAQHWYLNRQEASSERIPISVQAMIQQLRGVYYADH